MIVSMFLYTILHLRR